MFGWFDPVKKLERSYAKARGHAEKELARTGDRHRYAELIAKAEAIGEQLDEAKRAAATS